MRYIRDKAKVVKSCINCAEFRCLCSLPLRHLVGIREFSASLVHRLSLSSSILILHTCTNLYMDRWRRGRAWYGITPIHGSSNCNIGNIIMHPRVPHNMQYKIIDEAQAYNNIHTHPRLERPRMGVIPYQPLPLLCLSAYNSLVCGKLKLKKRGRAWEQG